MTTALLSANYNYNRMSVMKIIRPTVGVRLKQVKTTFFLCPPPKIFDNATKAKTLTTTNKNVKSTRIELFGIDRLPVPRCSITFFPRSAESKDKIEK